MSTFQAFCFWVRKKFFIFHSFRGLHPRLTYVDLSGLLLLGTKKIFHISLFPCAVPTAGICRPFRTFSIFSFPVGERSRTIIFHFIAQGTLSIRSNSTLFRISQVGKYIRTRYFSFNSLLRLRLSLRLIFHSSFFILIGSNTTSSLPKAHPHTL
jgi:hypothetical protein